MATAHKLNATLRSFIERQKMFFVATAARDGRVNVSPKGMDSLRLVDDNQLFWLNYSGSGNETATHLRDFARMTLMFCAFEGDAMILRLYGAAKTLHPRDPQWDQYNSHFDAMVGTRQIFIMDIDLVQTSCGTGVPMMDFVGARADGDLVPFFEDMGADGIRQYWDKKNTVSIDGKDTGIFKK